MKISRPEPGDYAPYTKPYIDTVGERDVLAVLRSNLDEMAEFYMNVPDNKWLYRYDEGKWSIPELLLHIMDAEQIFTYRILRIARGDQTPMAGFDENMYVDNCDISHRSRLSLVDEYRTTRLATLSLIEGLDEAAWQRAGTASGHRVTVSALCYLIAGHELHHKNVIRERYL